MTPSKVWQKSLFTRFFFFRHELEFFDFFFKKTPT